MRKLLAIIVLAVSLTACSSDEPTESTEELKSVVVQGQERPDFAQLEKLLASAPLQVLAPETVDALGKEDALKLFPAGSVYKVRESSWESSGDKAFGGRLVIEVYPDGGVPFQMDALFRREDDRWWLVQPVGIE